MITEIWLEIDELKARVRKIKDQSGLRNVIQKDLNMIFILRLRVINV
jgi:hypothetical protein